MCVSFQVLIYTPSNHVYSRIITGLYILLDQKGLDSIPHLSHSLQKHNEIYHPGITLDLTWPMKALKERFCYI